jgi:hypothetical protein
MLPLLESILARIKPKEEKKYDQLDVYEMEANATTS